MVPPGASSTFLSLPHGQVCNHHQLSPCVLWLAIRGPKDQGAWNGNCFFNILGNPSCCTGQNAYCILSIHVWIWPKCRLLCGGGKVCIEPVSWQRTSSVPLEHRSLTGWSRCLQHSPLAIVLTGEEIAAGGGHRIPHVPAEETPRGLGVCRHRIWGPRLSLRGERSVIVAPTSAAWLLRGIRSALHPPATSERCSSFATWSICLL